jgi:hypothetical protein
MRLYIRSRINGPRCPEYEFVRGSEAALFWNSRTWVEQVCRVIVQEGITIARPFSPERQPCSDFRAEPRPLGGFVISCDVPVLES